MSPSPTATPPILASGPTSATATPSPHRPPTPVEAEGSRRNHRKSRRGCGECKRRRIKCDEKRPICGRCALGRRQCPYSLLEPVLPPTSNGDPESMSGTCPTPSNLTPSPAPEDGVPPADSSQAMLLYHFMTSGVEIFMPDSFPNRMDMSFNPINFLASESLSCRYLLNQLLAFSARHFAHCHPERRDEYLYQAKAYQSHGIRLFTESTLHIDESNSTQALFFSWLLGVHQLCDVSLEGDSEGVLSRFLQYLDVYQGVRAVVSQAWVYMQHGSLRIFFDEGAEEVEKRGYGPQTALLEELIQGSLGLDEVQRRDCDEARCQLQAAFDHACTGNGEGDGGVGVSKTLQELQRSVALRVFSWPLVVGEGFLSAARARRPEALLVIAHFCVLLHWCRGYWVMGQTGQDLFEGIVQTLGPGWEKWLQTPMLMMEG